MSFTSWTQDLVHITKNSQFCLVDVKETITSGKYTLEFFLTETAEPEVLTRGRKGKLVCRSRLYLRRHSFSSTPMSQLEILDDFTFNTLEHEGRSKLSMSLRAFYDNNPKLCDAAVQSLRDKIRVISEQSTAVLKAQLDKEIVQLITARLAGDFFEEVSLKEMLAKQVRRVMNDVVVLPVKVTHKRWNTAVLEFEFLIDEVCYTFKAQPKANPEYCYVRIAWQGLALSYAPETHKVVIYFEGAAPPAQLLQKYPLEVDDLDPVSTRTLLLLVVNLPSFGKILDGKLNKIFQEV